MNRRKLLWTTPVIASVALPIHAATTDPQTTPPPTTTPDCFQAITEPITGEIELFTVSVFDTPFNRRFTFGETCDGIGLSGPIVVSFRYERIGDSLEGDLFITTNTGDDILIDIPPFDSAFGVNLNDWETEHFITKPVIGWNTNLISEDEITLRVWLTFRSFPKAS